MEHDRLSLLFHLGCEKLRTDKVVRPGLTCLERMVIAAQQQAQHETYRILTPAVARLSTRSVESTGKEAHPAVPPPALWRGSSVGTTAGLETRAERSAGALAIISCTNTSQTPGILAILGSLAQLTPGRPKKRRAIACVCPDVCEA